MNLNKKDLRKCDIVIILCAGDPDEGTFFEEFYSNWNCLGGDTRKRAAIEIAKSWDVEKFIVVGGGIEKKEEDQERKVNEMREFLIDANAKLKKEKIIRIISEANTLSNFRAIFKAFAISLGVQNEEMESKREKIASKLNKKEIGILTNFYHLPRALIFARDTFGRGVAFRALSAESIVQDESISCLHYPPGLLATVHSEIKGLRDWENGKYKNQRKKPKKWEGNCHRCDRKLLESLLNNLTDK